MFWVAVNALQSSAHMSGAAEGMAALHYIRVEIPRIPASTINDCSSRELCVAEELTKPAGTVRF